MIGWNRQRLISRWVRHCFGNHQFCSLTRRGKQLTDFTGRNNGSHLSIPFRCSLFRLFSLYQFLNVFHGWPIFFYWWHMCSILTFHITLLLKHRNDSIYMHLFLLGKFKAIRQCIRGFYPLLYLRAIFWFGQPIFKKSQ